MHHPGDELPDLVIPLYRFLRGYPYPLVSAPGHGPGSGQLATHAIPEDHEGVSNDNPVRDQCPVLNVNRVLGIVLDQVGESIGGPGGEP